VHSQARQEKHVSRANHISVTWIGAGLSVMTLAAFARRDAARLSVNHCLMHLGHYQYAVALSFDRLREIGYVEGEPQAGFELSMRRNAEIHLLAVSAHGFWLSLRYLANRIKEPPIIACFKAQSGVVANTKGLRDHFEHLVERFEVGRSSRRGKAMPQEVFSQSIGRFDGQCVHFGDEQFDLPEIAEAVLASGASMSEMVEAFFKARVEAVIGVALKGVVPEVGDKVE
jgi:hypothetical protein